MSNDRQLFILGPEIWASVSREEIVATGKSMIDAGIYSYPYEEFDVMACGSTKDMMPWIFRGQDNEEHWQSIKKDASPVMLEFRYYNLIGENFDYSIAVNVNKSRIFLPGSSEELLSAFSKIPRERAQHMNDLAADAVLTTLLVMLATRNVEKEILNRPKRYKDPLSKNGIKQIKNNDYKYVTTIKIGKIIETMPSNGMRGPVRPHLRRGHLRTQHFGVGNKETKKIFIQPVFVNADEGWIENQRKEYRVKL